MTESTKSKKDESAIQLAGALNKLDEKDIAYLTGYTAGVLASRLPEEKKKESEK